MISPYPILLFCLYYLLSLLHLLLCPISPYLFLILFLIVIRLSGLSSVWFNKNTIFLCLILWKPFQSMTAQTSENKRTKRRKSAKISGIKAKLGAETSKNKRTQ